MYQAFLQLAIQYELLIKQIKEQQENNIIIIKIDNTQPVVSEKKESVAIPKKTQEETTPSFEDPEPLIIDDPQPKPKIENPKLQSDLNNDGCVGMEDKALIEFNWGRVGDSIKSGDINKDGIVNMEDLSILESEWGRCI